MHRSRLTYFHNNITILTGFKNATLTSSYIYFKRHLYVKFLRSDDVIMKWLRSQLLNSNCTAKLEDGIEILSHRMNGYIQINVKTANLTYHKPANQNECFFSMTNKVHGTHLMLLGSLVGDLSLIKFCQMKQLTPILNILHFQCFKLIRSGQVFHVLFTNAYSLIRNQIVCFAFLFRQTLTLLPSVVFLKPVSIFSQAMKVCYSKVVYCLHVYVILP